MSQNARQELYDRIRETSKDEVILEEMIRLGYWPKNEGLPSASEEMVRRSGEISRELRKLTEKQRLWSNPEQALKEMHKQRKRAAMERRKETKLRQAQERHDRALAWAERRDNDILYLGAGTSAGLTNGAEAKTLLRDDLPALPDMRSLASAIGVPLAELRFLAYDRALSRINHYQRFLIPKKTGGHRQISAPMPRLKRVQYWILDNILCKVPVHKAAHGFVAERSIVTNAEEHVGRDVVVNLDLKDFFPTLNWRRVKGKFVSLGYSEAIATILALLCTEPDVDEVRLDGERFFARKGSRRLPQGAPTSPMMTNLICYRLDKRLTGLAENLGFTYTRYADDMTFSASGEAATKVGTLLRAVHDIVAAEGFTVHPDKTRIMRAHRRQEVTGLVVNDHVSVPRDIMDRFRALLHHLETKGTDGAKWGNGGNVLTSALGFAKFVYMVERKKGAQFTAQLDKLIERYGEFHSRKTMVDFREKAAAGERPLTQLAEAEARAAPEPEPVLAEHIAQEAAVQESARAADRAAATGASETLERQVIISSARNKFPLRIVLPLVILFLGVAAGLPLLDVIVGCTVLWAIMEYRANRNK